MHDVVESHKIMRDGYGIEFLPQFDASISVIHCLAILYLEYRRAEHLTYRLPTGVLQNCTSGSEIMDQGRICSLFIFWIDHIVGSHKRYCNRRGCTASLSFFVSV